MQDLSNNKMVLDFQVNKQSLKRIDTNRPVENSANYLYAQFAFSGDWQGTDKYAIFKWGEIILITPIDENGICKVANDVIKASGFNLTVRGEIANEVVITSNSIFVGVTSTILSGGTEAPVRFINTETLNFTKDGDVLNIEIPNTYGVSLTLDENGVVSLQGRNGEVLSQIDLPTEKIIKNVYYNEETQELVIQFENAQDVIIPITIDLSNYANDINLIDNSKIQLMSSGKPIGNQIIIDRAVTMELDQKSGILKLLGYDKDGNYVVLKEVDFEIEKILTNVYLDTTTNELVMEFINSQTIRIYVGDIFDIDNYYTKEQTDNTFVKQVNGKGLSSNDFTTEEKEKLKTLENYDDTSIKNKLESKQNKLTSGEGISISEDNVISISYANGDDLTYGN